MLLVLFYRSTNYFLSSQSTWNNFLSQIGSTNSVIQLEKSLLKNQEVNSGEIKINFEKSIVLKDIDFKYSNDSSVKNLDSINLEIPLNKTSCFCG